MNTEASLTSADLITAVLERFRLEFRDLPLQVASTPDAQSVEIRLGPAAVTYDIELRRPDRTSELAVLGEQFRHSPRPRLMLAEYMTLALAKSARLHGVQFLDRAGNAHLHVGDSVVWAAGNPRQTEALPHEVRSNSRVYLGARGRNTGTTAATRILFVILSQAATFPTLTQRWISAHAGVSLGIVSQVLSALEQRGWIRLPERSGNAMGRPGRLLEPDLLLQEFAVNYAARLRDKILRIRLSPTDPHWNADLNLQDFGALWGGEVAAERLLGDYRPSRYTLYLEEGDALQSMVRTHRLRSDPEGSIAVLDAFWKGALPYDNRGHVPPPLIYAELMTLGDARAVEMARRVRTFWLEHELGQG